MVIEKLLVLVCLFIAACSFEERSFKDDLACESDHDCARPDQECRAGLCTQRTCSPTATCPIGHEFSCASGLCVVAECSSETSCSDGYACNAGYCQASFNVASVASVNNTAIAITFDSPPDAATAGDADNYSVAGLTLSSATLSGSTVTLTTTSQTTTSYTVTVSNVLREFDKSPLITTTGTFTGRGAFSLVSAASTSAITVALTFTEPPNATETSNPANYAISNGLTVQNVSPTIAGNVVTLTTGTQTGATYTVTVSNLHRANDSEPLATNSATFGGRTNFNIATIEVKSSTQIAVTFDAAPSAAQAVTLANYSVPGLTLIGTPALAGNVVTLTTSAQTEETYTLAVSGVTRSSDGEALTVATIDFTGRPPFNVSDALARTTRSISVTFDGPPDATQATTLANYSVGGLVLSGTPILAGNVVFLETSTQTAASYTVTVSNVRRAGDAEALTDNNAMFAGRPPFNVAAASATSSTSIAVTFSDAPNSGQAVLAGNYVLSGGVTVLDASAPTGNTVMLTTTPMMAIAYTVTVAGVTRASDGEALTTGLAMFTGRAPFNVASAAAPTSATITVTFDAPPNPAAATTLANYNVPGLTLLGTPVLSSSTVTITTGAQLTESYTVTVTNVPRATDGEVLMINTAAFTGRPKFNVASASSGSNVTLRVTFDAAPNPTQATTLSNYSVNGLALSGTPTLSGNTVTIMTANQTGTTAYTVIVSGVTRLDGEPLTISSAMFSGLTGFNVTGAVSNNTTTATVTFDAPPMAGPAQTASNYTITGNGGLTVSSASLSGNTVTLTTTEQLTGTYTVAVGSAVTRASDDSPLVVTSAQFSYVSFNVAGATGLTNKSAAVTFDAAPNASQAGVQANYSVACAPTPCTNITLSAPVLSGNTVTLTTTSQEAGKNYTITVTNVTRASDGSTLATKTGTFVGRSAFNVVSAAASTSGTMTVTFDGVPDPALATNVANYTVPGLTLSGTPVITGGNVVTINTSVQTATTYTVSVANVTRASDGEPLSTASVNFTGKAQTSPTVTNVVVQSTVPDNGTTFYNTGTATVVITGTEFNGVNCLTGVKLDDVDGAGVLVNTKPTSCAVNSATSITATFPAGIRSNYSGWNVHVTNSVNTNTTSSVRLVVKAGLLVSEIYVGSSNTGNETKEYLEIYNPTANTINLDTVGVVIHVRNGGGTDGVLTTSTSGSACGGGICTKDIPAGKFWLLVSTVSTADSWYANRDAVYTATSGAQLTTNGSVYLSLSTTAQSRVIDKAGWGSQAAVLGREGGAITTFGNDNRSAQREPGATAATTDTDSNTNDFNGPSTTISPTGTRN